MASQISHIIYARKYFDQLEAGGFRNAQKINRDEFILGSVFPDIRRIDSSISRTATHLFFPVIDLDFQGLSSFEAGWKFHLYCDMRREDILNKKNFYSHKFTTDSFNLPAKLLEDELIYEEYNNWEKIEKFFSRPPFPKIKNIEISPETFRLWYAILASYAKKKPDEKSMRIFLSKMPKNAPRVNSIIESVKKLKKNKKVAEILRGVKDEIL
jgi:hypothetical protein